MPDFVVPKNAPIKQINRQIVIIDCFPIPMLINMPIRTRKFILSTEKIGIITHVV